MASPAHNTALDFREYVQAITEEMQTRIEQQRQAILALLDQRRGEGHPIAYCPLVDCRPKRKLREAIREAIEVLEDTRRAFKSRQLEELRLKLEAALAEDTE